MSKILRRPMFRGGGKVSSYGNGIATGLADGGRVGLEVGGVPAWARNADTRGYNKTGGDLLKENMPQFSRSEIMNFIKQNPSSANTGIFNSTGLEVDNEGNFSENENQYYKERFFRPKGEDESYTNYMGGFDVSESEGGKQTEFEKVYRDMLTPAMDFDFQAETASDADKRKNKIESSSIEEIINESIIPGNNTKDEPYISPTMTMKQAEMNQGNVMPGVEVNEGEVVIRGGGEDEGIQAMADNYFKLMGGDKARGQDISDMLLRFSGAEGDTVGEKFKNYTKIESTAKSRTRDLKDKATGFAIQESSQNKLLDKKLQAQSDIADKNLIATVAKLDRDGQYKKKVDDIIRDRFNGDQSKRAEASRIALGDEATIEAAVFDKTAGGMPLSPGSFDLLAAGYTDGPIPGGDLAGISGTFFIPGKMQIITIVEGVVDQNTLKDFSPKA